MSLQHWMLHLNLHPMSQKYPLEFMKHSACSILCDKPVAALVETKMCSMKNSEQLKITIALEKHLSD
jgi:hypothetical protein